MLARVIVAIVLLLLPTAVLAQVEKRLALLIGNQGYAAKVGLLKNPHNDVSLIETSLPNGAPIRLQSGLGSVPIRPRRRPDLLRQALEAMPANPVVLGRVLGIAVAEIVLRRPEIGALIGQVVASTSIWTRSGDDPSHQA